MTPKLYKAADVCELAKLQPYVLRSWEKEFPGIGVQKSAESQRLYRQSDLDQVLRIKQLVFGEGLTLAGARRRLEAQLAAAAPAIAEADDADEVLETLGQDARARIATRARRTALAARRAVAPAGSRRAVTGPRKAPGRWPQSSSQSTRRRRLRIAPAAGQYARREACACQGPRHRVTSQGGARRVKPCAPPEGENEYAAQARQRLAGVTCAALYGPPQPWQRRKVRATRFLIPLRLRLRWTIPVKPAC